GLAGQDGGATCPATGDWATPRTRTAAVALGGILSFAHGGGMLRISMAPLFSGLGVYCHAPGGVSAPPRLRICPLRVKGHEVFSVEPFRRHRDGCERDVASDSRSPLMKTLLLSRKSVPTLGG